MMSIVCSNCGNLINPSKKEQTFIQECAQKGMRLAIINCPNCPLGKIDPVVVMDPNSATKTEPELPSYRCPVARCHGFVSYIDTDGKPYWGCGECGCFWRDKKNLFKEVTAIIKKYTYRKHSYKREKGKWLPNPLSNEPTGYEGLVEEEPSGLTNEYMRG